MDAYCKHCHYSHAAWNRLNDGYICGRCGARERDPQVTPTNAALHQAASKNHSPRIQTAVTKR